VISACGVGGRKAVVDYFFYKVTIFFVFLHFQKKKK